MNPYARHLGTRDPLKVVATTARHLEQLSVALGPLRIEESPARFAVAVRVDAAYAPAYRGWAETLNALGRGDEARPLLAQAAAVERRNRAPLPLRQIAAHARRVR